MRFEYEGKLLFAFNRAGFALSHKGDELIRPWIWSKAYTGIYSTNLKRDFSNIQEYWMYLGEIRKQEALPTNKIRGYMTDEIIKHWVQTTLLFGFYVVMYDINVQKKPANFWISIPKPERLELLKDVVVLRCSDLKEVKSVCDSVSSDFATAIGVHAGEIQYWNEDFRRLEDDRDKT